MARYLCRISDATGAIRIEEREARDEDALLAEISHGKNFLISFSLDDGTGKVKRHRQYSEKTVLEFTRVLAVLLDAGLSLESALDVAAGIFKAGASGKLVAELLEGVRKGESFSARLELFGATFPPVYRGMVRIGERTGRLEPMFLRIAAYMEEQKKLSDKVKGALMYPSLVLSLVVLMILGIVLFLVPGLRSLFGNLGTGLPPRTASALAFMNVFAWGLLAAGAVGVAFFLGARSVRAHGGSPAIAIDRLSSRVPFLGRYAMLRECLSFSFAMETLVASGIAIEDALEESTSVLRNAAMEADIISIRTSILAGTALSAAFDGSPSFPPEFARWAAVGERTGKVDSIFSQTRTYFQYELDRWTTQFMSLIEPALIIAVGAILVTIILLFIVPFLTSFTAIT
ncbi:MAG TPA: type II secretion system F family protein [Rectinemataceae bacterium]|nr:type II secretion system F family protein [Rectinemataceae bacterium]